MIINYKFKSFYLKASVPLVVLVFSLKIVSAQINKDTPPLPIADVTDSYMNFAEYTGLVGSPFYNKDWVKADVTLRNGIILKDTLVRYSDLKDQLYTCAPGNQYITFHKAVIEFTIINQDATLSHFSIFPGNGKFADGAFFEVLSDGDIKLLKKNVKTISENRAGIGTAVFTRTVVDNIDYYLLINGKAIRIKKDKRSVEALLKNKKPELNAYLQANNLDLKKDDDLAKLINYYNTL
ncbi:MAG TPA: hypothetical protein VL490_00810 [Mucilaginibacter sp.]|nr:hypothetical protein [Mucilaginibacter sp.]